MKKIYILSILMMVGAMIAHAQAAHQVLLTWTDPNNTSWNVYRAPGACTGMPAFTKITSTPITAKTYTDLAVVAGTTYCYAVTGITGGSESSPSNQATATVPSGTPPTGTSATPS